MSKNNMEIREWCLTRLSKLFKVDKSKLFDNINFMDLDVSDESLFRRHEYDIVTDDIQDAATKSVLKRIHKGEIVIHTVGDYISYMTMCYEECPKMVESIFKNQML